MKTIHWAMIGCGAVTEKKSGPAFYKAKNSTLHGVFGRSRSKALDYAARHGVPQVYGNLAELMADPVIDAVYIATPPGSHKEYALACAAARKPCYIEKPMALNYTECREIAEAFRQAKTKCFVAYYRRRLPRFLKVKKLIQTGALGSVRFAHVSFFRPFRPGEEKSWRVDPAIAGGGLFMDMAVHQLDALDFLLGPITGVKSFRVNQAGHYAPEDIVHALFTFPDGITGSGDWCFTAGFYRDEIEIVGEKGAIRFACFGTGPIILETSTGREPISAATPDHIQQSLIQSIVDDLNGEDTCPSTAESAARTAWVCDQIYGRQ